jgi:hypothetical protein
MAAVRIQRAGRDDRRERFPEAGTHRQSGPELRGQCLGLAHDIIVERAEQAALQSERPQQGDRLLEVAGLLDLEIQRDASLVSSSTSARVLRLKFVIKNAMPRHGKDRTSLYAAAWQGLDVPKAVLEVTDIEREQLVRWERRRKSSQALALRSRIV